MLGIFRGNFCLFVLCSKYITSNPFHVSCFFHPLEISNKEQFLIYGQSFPGSIHGISMNSSIGSLKESMVPILNLESPRAVEFWAKKKFVYYADSYNYVIARQKLDGSERKSLLTERKILSLFNISVQFQGCGKNGYTVCSCFPLF